MLDPAACGGAATAENPRSAPVLVSVVIPAHSAVPTVTEQLGALANQTYPGAWEIVISDNGNNAGLAELVANHPVNLVTSVRIVDSTDRAGVSHARNVGFRAAQGDLIAFVDHDDHAHPDWLAEIADKARYFDSISGSRDVTKLNSTKAQGWRPISNPEAGLVYPGFLRAFVGSNFAIWRDVMEAVGEWDVDFVGGGDDLDYAWRIQEAGFTLGHAHGACIDYRLRETLRGACRQIHNYGVMDALLHRKHREFGYHPSRPDLFFQNLLVLAIYNPLVPDRYRPFPRGQWFTRVALMSGRVRGSIRYRTITL